MEASTFDRHNFLLIIIVYGLLLGHTSDLEKSGPNLRDLKLQVYFFVQEFDDPELIEHVRDLLCAINRDRE